MWPPAGRSGIGPYRKTEDFRISCRGGCPHPARAGALLVLIRLRRGNKIAEQGVCSIGPEENRLCRFSPLI